MRRHMMVKDETCFFFLDGNEESSGSRGTKLGGGTEDAVLFIAEY